MAMKFNIDAQVFIHQRNDWHGPDSITKTYSKLGKYHSYPIYYQFHTKIDNCLETSDRFRDQCFYERMSELLMKEVGCTVPWLPDKSTICTNGTKSKMAWNLYYLNNMNTEKNCSITCTSLETFTYPPSHQLMIIGLATPPEH